MIGSVQFRSSSRSSRWAATGGRWQAGRSLVHSSDLMGILNPMSCLAGIGGQPSIRGLVVLRDLHPVNGPSGLTSCPVRALAAVQWLVKAGLWPAPKHWPASILWLAMVSCLNPLAGPGRSLPCDDRLSDGRPRCCARPLLDGPASGLWALDRLHWMACLGPAVGLSVALFPMGGSGSMSCLDFMAGPRPTTRWPVIERRAAARLGPTAGPRPHGRPRLRPSADGVFHDRL